MLSRILFEDLGSFPAQVRRDAVQQAAAQVLHGVDIRFIAYRSKL